ncbi:hypothetical protein [uncultured Methanobrevibacter sp.]|nr:hypothetical protein [uncultured Methanobrevibacter sp.]
MPGPDSISFCFGEIELLICHTFDFVFARLILSVVGLFPALF